MKRPFLFILLACGMVSVPLSAAAADEGVVDNEAAPLVPMAAAPATIEIDPGFYATMSLGGNWPSNRSSSGEAGRFTEYSIPGLSTELGAGYNFKPVRVELTYALDGSDLKSYDSVSGGRYQYSNGGQTIKSSGFASVYWDMFPKQRFTPYIGAGIGISYLRVQSFSEPGYRYEGYGRSLFGYQAKAGLSYTMDRKTRLFAEAVFRGTGSYDTNDGFDEWSTDSFSSWGGQLGVRIGL